MPLTADERLRLRRACTLVVPGFAEPSAADDFRALADWCALHGVEHDRYGEGELVEGFERKVAALLGKPAAVFMPSGVMAQGAAVKVWTEAARLPRIGLHPTSHLLLHEEQAPSALFGCHAVVIGERARPMTAEDLAASRQPLACAIVELPLREAGGRLPAWRDLCELQDAARARGVKLHLDGARLWECAAFYGGRSYADIAAGFDSVYVSFYKGIGALSGALLLGSDDFIAEARLWRRRMGGTLFHLSPMVASAAMRFDERLALMPALYRRAVDFAAALAPFKFLRVDPAVPETNLLHLYVDAPADAVTEARDRIATESAAWLFGNLRRADVPGWSVCELYVGDALLGVDDARLRPLFERLGALLKPG